MVSRTELPALDRIPGQTVYSQLFENVNVAPETPALERKDLQRSQKVPRWSNGWNVWRMRKD